jgi:hypothetical protein
VNQLAMDFVSTRARTVDPETSKEAAKAAITDAACAMRRLILQSLRLHGPQTAREISLREGLEYIATQRRISEVGFIEKTPDVRDGCHVWQAQAWKEIK